MIRHEAQAVLERAMNGVTKVLGTTIAIGLRASKLKGVAE